MFNIYCDESCHLEKDTSDVMVLGGIICSENMKQKIYEDIRKLKEESGLSSWFEIKWTKVSPGKLDFYKKILDYFFSSQDLYFRAVIATGKKQLDHDAFNNGDYDSWYYKMYYTLLKPVIKTEEQYKIFIDIKDTRGGKRVKELHKVLGNTNYDFSNRIVTDIKQIQSNESELLQVADLLIGALGYYHRGLYDYSDGSPAKKALVDYVINACGRNIISSSPVAESKFNIFIWKPRGTY